MMNKLVTLDQIKKMRPQLTGVVLAGGVFDLLHIGHINHLRRAKSLGDTLIVHVTGDKRVKAKKGKHQPFQPEHERAAIIAALESVDFAFNADVPHYDKQILDVVKPDIIFFNADGYTSEVEVYLKRIGWHDKVYVSNLEKFHNTSDIITKIAMMADRNYAAKSR